MFVSSILGMKRARNAGFIPGQLPQPAHSFTWLPYRPVGKELTQYMQHLQGAS